MDRSLILSLARVGPSRDPPAPRSDLIVKARNRTEANDASEGSRNPLDGDRPSRLDGDGLAAGGRQHQGTAPPTSSACRREAFKADALVTSAFGARPTRVTPHRRTPPVDRSGPGAGPPHDDRRAEVAVGPPRKAFACEPCNDALDAHLAPRRRPEGRCRSRRIGRTRRLTVDLRRGKHRSNGQRACRRERVLPLRSPSLDAGMAEGRLDADRTDFVGREKSPGVRESERGFLLPPGAPMLASSVGSRPRRADGRAVQDAALVTRPRRRFERVAQACRITSPPPRVRRAGRRSPSTTNPGVGAHAPHPAASSGRRMPSNSARSQRENVCGFPGGCGLRRTSPTRLTTSSPHHALCPMFAPRTNGSWNCAVGPARRDACQTWAVGRLVTVRRGRRWGWWVEGRRSSGGLFRKTWWPTEGMARAMGRWIGGDDASR